MKSAKSYIPGEPYIPGKVSVAVVDAWLCVPPCDGPMPYCHVQCPYLYQCHPEEFEDLEDYE